MKTNSSYRLKDFIYLLSLYFKRGKGINLFYIIMLILGLVLPGVLLESNAKIDSLITEVNKKLPPNRVKISVPQNVRTSPGKGMLTGLFGMKTQDNTKSSVKYKDYITGSILKNVKEIPGVKNPVPLYSLDFPMGMVIVFPGSSTPIQTQMIGSGMSTQDANPFISEFSRIKQFQYKKGQPIPVMASRFVIPVVNALAQNNGIENFELTEKDLVGIKLKVFIGRSLLSSSLGQLGNGEEKEFADMDNASFSDVVECIIVGFVDMDYSMGLLFPQDFLAKYKKLYWGNFTQDSYDSVVLDLPLDKADGIKTKLKEMGFDFAADVGILNKVSDMLQNQQKGLGVFLGFISIIITLFGAIILFYTLIWTLKGKTLEFSVYQFFGASRSKLIVLYSTYLTILNIIGFIIAKVIVGIVFYGVKAVALSFESRVPVEYQDIFQAPFLNQLLVFNSFWIAFFLVLQVVSVIFISVYLKRLNDNM